MTTVAPDPADELAAEAADEPRGRLVTWLEKYRNAFSVARATLFWACLSRHKRTMRWLFVMLLIAGIANFRIIQLTRAMVDEAIVDQTAAVAVRHADHVLGDLGTRLQVHPDAAR
jgi:hypothetical protein